MSTEDRERAARLRAKADKIEAALTALKPTLDRAAAHIDKLQRWVKAARENAEILERAP
jgi:hypothetical protein